MTKPPSFLTPHELAALYGCLILNASYYLDGGAGKARSQFMQNAIDGAKFWDIDACSDPHSTLPHMLAPDHVFKHFWASTNWTKGQPICVYDQLGLFSAPRLAWELSKRQVPAEIYLLAGGLPAWESAQLETSPGVQIIEPIAANHERWEGCSPITNSYSMSGILSDLARNQTKNFQIIDARSPGRFYGVDSEPRPGLRSGHIPGSLNLPYTSVVENGQFSENFELNGIELNHRLITTCGSGITAAGLALALENRGAINVHVFDGSWAQWGDPAAMTPISTSCSEQIF